jgi:hypothetical protein
MKTFISLLLFFMSSVSFAIYGSKVTCAVTSSSPGVNQLIVGETRYYIDDLFSAPYLGKGFFSKIELQTNYDDGSPSVSEVLFEYGHLGGLAIDEENCSSRVNYMKDVRTVRIDKACRLIENKFKTRSFNALIRFAGHDGVITIYTQGSMNAPQRTFKLGACDYVQQPKLTVNRF